VTPSGSVCEEVYAEARAPVQNHECPAASAPEIGTLIAKSEQLQSLRQDPKLIDNAVDEMIRWVTPVRHFLRYAQEDYALHDAIIRKGERVLLSSLPANWDETVFENPFRFDVTRANANQHLAFGIGVHFFGGPIWRAWSCEHFSASCCRG
jgi:hypothetical protein